ncbi:MAG TPA: CSLREA domain-containing protein, partial [Solirubrobacterales bacterium]
MLTARLQRVLPPRWLRYALPLALALVALYAAVGQAASMTFTVTTTADTGAGSLRQAILDANSNSGADTINFNISGSAPFTIQPTSSLPTITDAVVIDGTSQPGFSGTPIVELNGSSAGSTTDGLTVSAAATTIKGLVINRFGRSGIHLSGSTGSVVKGNFIGTDVAGSSDLGNARHGVNLNGATNAVIGGSTSADRNLISGNDVIGVFVSGSGHSIKGNYIGSNAAGTAAIPNQNGIQVLGGATAATNNTIGGTGPGDGNLISGNTFAGVLLNVFSANRTQFNTIAGNRIGTQADGVSSLGNGGYGVVIDSNSGIGENVIGGATAGAGNVIAHNSPAGVAVLSGSTRDRVVGNSIFSNTGLGIDLGATGVAANDPDDPDAGANNLQNFPVLADATAGGGETQVSGTLDSEPSKTYRLEFFSNPGCDPSGNGEGKTYLGTTDVTTNATGDASFAVTLPTGSTTGDAVTATATDPDGNTSEFSACETATGAPVEDPSWVVNTENDVDDGACTTLHCSLREAINRSNAEAGADTIQFNIPGSGPFTIEPTSALPAITDPATIDAGCSPVKSIELSGVNAPGADGLHITAGNSTVRGLAVNRFTGSFKAGIRISGAGGNTVVCNYLGTDPTGTVDLGNVWGLVVSFSDSNTVGGATTEARNVISGNGAGVAVQGNNNVIAGNFIGTDASGASDLGNSGNGVAVADGSIESAPSAGNVVGGSAPGAGNVISGNDQRGIDVQGNYATATRIEGNRIGTDATGNQDLGNSQFGVSVQTAPGTVIGGLDAGEGNQISGNNVDGVRIVFSSPADPVQVLGNLIGTDADGNAGITNNQSGVLLQSATNVRVGGTSPGARNVISGNGTGIHVSEPPSVGNSIQGNYIGTEADGTGGVPNGTGIRLGLAAEQSTIGGSAAGAGNLIAHNSSDGVELLADAGDGNRILQNSISSNGALGIDLAPNGVTANDSGDGDAGPNNLQNFPVLTEAVRAGFDLTVSGSLESEPNKTYRLEFFASPSCDPSGNGEGATPLGVADLPADGSGVVSIEGLVLEAPESASDVITATATDPDGNTSEFSACIAQGAAPPQATITGAKFHDQNHDGVRDAGEPGLPNWTIRAYA